MDHPNAVVGVDGSSKYIVLLLEVGGVHKQLQCQGIS
jgi:hypothetical protein